MPLPRWTRTELREREAAESRLAETLSALMDRPLAVRLTRNRKRLISVRVDARGRRTLRVHSALAEASQQDLRILADWMLDRPGAHEAARTLLSRYRDAIDRTSALRASRAPRLTAIPGRHHDLVGLLRDVKGRFFPDVPDVYIAWSGRIGTARRRRLGSWNPAERLVRIHACLDRAEVPEYFVASIIHHELCHAAVEVSLTPTGRRRLHGPEFRRLEAQFPDLARAQAWERANVRGLLR